jgi:serine/threonine-protein kinase
VAQLGDEAAYRNRCVAMLERFRDAAQPEIAERTAKACVLLPGAVDPETCARLAGRAVEAGGQYLPFFEMARGMAEYRCGRDENALEWLDKARASLTAVNAAPTFYATCDYFRSMALLRLGRSDESRQALAEADREVAGLGFTPGQDDFGFTGPENLLICSVARREAKAVAGKAPTP